MTSGPRRTKVGRRARFTLVVISLALLLLFCLALILQQPWQQKVRVLTANIPGTECTVELWEKPYSYFGLGYEYSTWLVVRSRTAEGRWHLIDERYITFTDVSLLLSPNRKTVRVEVGRGPDAHMIAEYDIEDGEFRAKSEATVRHVKGWSVFATAHVH